MNIFENLIYYRCFKKISISHIKTSLCGLREYDEEIERENKELRKQEKEEYENAQDRYYLTDRTS